MDFIAAIREREISRLGGLQIWSSQFAPGPSSRPSSHQEMTRREGHLNPFRIAADRMLWEPVRLGSPLRDVSKLTSGAKLVEYRAALLRSQDEGG
jgi:hypothetical protein